MHEIFNIPKEKFDRSLSLGFIFKKNNKYWLTGFEDKIEILEIKSPLDYEYTRDNFWLMEEVSAKHPTEITLKDIERVMKPYDNDTPQDQETARPS